MCLRGPFLLQLVDLFVGPGEVGVYVLSRDGKNADYVGRSDENLRSRIKSSAAEGRGYHYFWYQSAGNPWEAYKLEQELYLLYHPKDNSIEPAAPKNLLASLVNLYKL